MASSMHIGESNEVMDSVRKSPTSDLYPNDNTSDEYITETSESGSEGKFLFLFKM